MCLSPYRNTAVWIFIWCGCVEEASGDAYWCWWEKHCLTFHEFTSSLGFLALTHTLIGMLQFLSWKTPWIMHSKQLATCPIITTLCYAIFGPAILEKDLGQLHSHYGPTSAQLRITHAPCFLPFPKHKTTALKQYRWTPLDYCSSACILSSWPLCTQTYNSELNLIHKWFMLKWSSDIAYIYYYCGNARLSVLY